MTRAGVAQDLSGNSPSGRIYCGGLDWRASIDSGVHIGGFITLISHDTGETLSHNLLLGLHVVGVFSKRIKTSDFYPQFGNSTSFGTVEHPNVPILGSVKVQLM